MRELAEPCRTHRRTTQPAEAHGEVDAFGDEVEHVVAMRAGLEGAEDRVTGLLTLAMTRAQYEGGPPTSNTSRPTAGCSTSISSTSPGARASRSTSRATIGARAYLRDVPDARLHLLDTGHFALEEEAPRIATLVDAFLGHHA
ncbi:alpha/beta fold hydrolase [Dokdonella fugitiva]|nr:hypothetical protein [Dokdonella fugitiva]